MFNRRIIFIVSLLLVFINYLGAQNCDLTLKGKVVDEASELPLAYVNVLIQELATGAVTDDEGDFVIENICPGEYHLIFSHIGCEAVKVHVDLHGDQDLEISLEHHDVSLENIVVHGSRSGYSNQPNASVSRQSIEDNSNENLSALLENQAGVHVIKNGSGIAKPVVHGMYGNRLTILNNGIAQSGQQWGNDHSPEIDPFAVDKITVIKGANALEYGSGNLGSVILLEPNKIRREPHLHGQVGYAFETNGRGSTLNARLGKYSKILAWRISGTLKKYGDKKTAAYFLNNTGIEEANLSLQLEKSWNDKFFLDFYASTFNNRLGILRGSHIGNIPDLKEALVRDKPFLTEPNFSYGIEAPKQEITHHLAKLKANYYLGALEHLELVLAGQLNNRKEFDIRRNERTDIPSLSLFQFTTNVELKYVKEFGENWKMNIGNQAIITNNTNDPGTDILPLIPDYLSWKNGTYIALTKKKEKTYMNFGLRYDYEGQSVAAISKSIPREIIRYNNKFQNIGGMLGVKYELSSSQTLSWNSGYAMRNPAVNELYSNGLHQGVSGIEEGDVDLKTEKSINNSLEYKWIPSTKISISSLFYFQHIKDYIFLNPQDEIRPTIRGAFPVFKYEQTSANIYGLDMASKFTLSSSLLAVVKYSFLRGNNITEDIPIVFLPPNSLFGSLSYRSGKSVKLAKNVMLEDLELEINNKYVFRQSHLLADQDFVAPPNSYNLLGAKLSTNLIFPKSKFRFYTKVDNLLNVKYRDYMNRQRYFADDVGISLTMGLNFKF